MKFRVDWSIDQDNWIAVYKRWSSMSPQERANNIPAGGKLLGRWHDMSGRTGVAIVESDDQAFNVASGWFPANRKVGEKENRHMKRRALPPRDRRFEFCSLQRSLGALAVP